MQPLISSSIKLVSLLVCCVPLFSGSAAAETDHRTWQSYTDKNLGIELKCPKNWHIYPSDSAGLILLSTAKREKFAHGVGLPPPYDNVWMDILKGHCSGVRLEKDYTLEESGLYAANAGGTDDPVMILRKSKCLANARVNFGLFDLDPRKEAHKKILEAIYETIQQVPLQ